MLGMIGYSTGSTESQEYRSISKIKPISISTIGLTLKLFSVVVLAPGMPNGAFSVLFLNFVPELNLSMETT